MQDKITSVNKIAQQEREGQLNESIELTDPLNKKIEDILKIKDKVPGLTPYPSSESLCEFESDENRFGTILVLCNKSQTDKKENGSGDKSLP